MVIGGLVSLPVCFSPKYKYILMIDSKGFTDFEGKGFFIPWSNVKRVFTDEKETRWQTNIFLCVEIKKNEALLANLSAFKRKSINYGLSHCPIIINLFGTGEKPEDICDIIIAIPQNISMI